MRLFAEGEIDSSMFKEEKSDWLDDFFQVVDTMESRLDDGAEMIDVDYPLVYDLNRDKNHDAKQIMDDEEKLEKEIDERIENQSANESEQEMFGIDLDILKKLGVIDSELGLETEDINLINDILNEEDDTWYYMPDPEEGD